jgi:hypothetical protein
MFKSEKRKKELKRLKKQEEKRQRRVQKDLNPGQADEVEVVSSEPEIPETGTAESTEQP